MQTDRPKALIILTPGFPANEGDSTCLPPQQVFVKALQETHPGLKIIVLTFQYPFKPGKYIWNGVEVNAFGGKGRGKLLRRLLWFSILKQLKALHKSYRIIGLLSFWLDECAYVGNKFAKEKGLRHLCWLLGQDAKPDNKYALRIKPQGGDLIALSDFIVNEYAKNYDVTPAHVIPVGIDPRMFGNVEQHRDIDILGVGSLISLKQFDVLIKMVSHLKQAFPNIKAVICGDGPERERLGDIINPLGLTDNIVLNGELPHYEVLNLMQRSKLLLHPSAYEGFGSVCLEALYAGASVVSFVKPMNRPISKWHAVSNEQEMLQTLEAILKNKKRDTRPVLPYMINDNARAMMALFNYSEAAIE